MGLTAEDILRIFFGISLLVLLSACAALQREQLAVTTMDYNLLVEKAENEMLLLNVIRASKRRPLYFTDFNLLRGNMSYSFQASGIIPFGKIGAGLDGSYSVVPNIGFSNNPSFDFAVLDTQEFMRGILAPVPMQTIDYYWQSGWPKEMLLNLFVDKIRISDAAGRSKLFDNEPDKPETFKNFQEEARRLANCKIEKRVRPVGPAIRKEQAEDLYLQIELEKAGLKLVPDRNGDYLLYQQQTPKFDYVFNCDNEIYTVLDARAAEKTAGQFYLRSPAGILYYLGEILRADKEVLINIDKTKSANLFAVHKGEENNVTPSVAVVYEGIRYFVAGQVLPPRAAGAYSSDRSMQVLSLIEQLIDLQKKGEIVPVTGVVNVIGR